MIGRILGEGEKVANRKARYERRQQGRDRRLRESRSARPGNFRRNLVIAAGGLAIGALLIGGFVLFAVNSKELPPTGFGPGHSELLPQQQVNFRPIPRPIQEHVMERGGVHLTGGMLVEYNCEDYKCEPELVDKLAEIVQDYPPQVYMAPYPDMDAMIALAAPGRLLTLETFDEDKIREFISRNLTR